MEDEKRIGIGKSGQNDSGTQISALESAEDHLARSASASHSGDGRGKAFSAAFASLLEWGERNSLIRNQAEFTFFKRPPDGFGDEHEAWFDAASSRWFKATYPNKFGRGWYHEETATPAEYLTRLALANRFFADDIRLIALVNSDQQLRILTSQPHIAGEAAHYEEIQAWFREFGFEYIEADKRIAWYRNNDNLLVADAHEGNVIRDNNGILVPIDLNIIQPSGKLLDWVRSALG